MRLLALLFALLFCLHSVSAKTHDLPLELAVVSGIILAVMIIILMLWVGRHEVPPDHETQEFIHKAYQQGLSAEQIVEKLQKSGWDTKRAHKQLHHYHKHYHKRFSASIKKSEYQSK